MNLMPILLELTDPEGSTVVVNAADIVTMRSVNGGQLLAEGAHCAITTLDGKYIAVKEDCKSITAEIGSRTQFNG